MPSITLAKIKKKIEQLVVQRTPMLNYDNMLYLLPYKPPLTVLEREQCLPSIRKEYNKMPVAGCKVLVATSINSLSLVLEWCNDRLRSCELVLMALSKLSVDGAPVSIRIPDSQRYDLGQLSFSVATGTIKCLPLELRESVSSLAAQLESEEPEVVCALGWMEGLLAFWVARLLGVSRIVIHCGEIAALVRSGEAPFWMKEQLTFMVQHPGSFFIANNSEDFSILRAFLSSLPEGAVFDDEIRCRLITGMNQLNELVVDVVQDNMCFSHLFPSVASRRQFEVAVMPDDGWSHDIDVRNSFSYDWINFFLEKGHNVRLVDVYDKDILKQISGCHGFMWRWSHLDGQYLVAQKLLPVIERELRIPVFPDQRTCWHYDDKVAQEYLLAAHDIPRPKTWVWNNRDRALRWLREDAILPLVLKLATGAASTNVILLRTVEEAEAWIYLIFDQGVFETEKSNNNLAKLMYRSCKDFMYNYKTGFSPALKDHLYTYHRGYVLFQQFLPNNTFDTRANVIGNRCFVFRRYTRPNDFRASGSGLIDYDQSVIDKRFIHLAFDTARKLGTQSVAIDGLYDGDNVVLGEVSYTYMAYPLFACGGYWQLDGAPWSGELSFVAEPVWPGRAIAEDFLQRLEAYYD